MALFIGRVVDRVIVVLDGVIQLCLEIPTAIFHPYAHLVIAAVCGSNREYKTQVRQGGKQVSKTNQRWLNGSLDKEICC